MLGKNIATLSTGIDLPSGIFSLAVNFFNIESGLFLTYEPDSNYFTPFSSLSVDETTLRRCKIKIDVLNSNNLIFSGTNIHPSISKEFLKDYVSKRLWDTIENLDMFIFSHHDKIFGLLIMFNLNINSNSQYHDFASFFIRKCSELFFNSRSKVICSLPATSTSPPIDLADAVNEIIKHTRRFTDKSITSVKLVYINYSKIVAYITEKNSSIDKHRIEDDIYKMYSSMLFGSSFIIKFKNKSILLCLATGLNNDNSIVKHQMSSSLISLFEANSLITPPTINIIDCELDDNELSVKVNELINSNL